MKIEQYVEILLRLARYCNGKDCDDCELKDILCEGFNYIPCWFLDEMERMAETWQEMCINHKAED